MRLFFKKKKDEVMASAVLFGLGWLMVLLAVFIEVHWFWMVLLTNLFLAGGMFLRLHAEYAEKPFDLRLTEIKIAAVLFLAGWIQMMTWGGYSSGGWMSILIANLLMASGMYLFFRSLCEKPVEPS